MDNSEELLTPWRQTLEVHYRIPQSPLQVSILRILNPLRPRPNKTP
jgi:hypothetical protein